MKNKSIHEYKCGINTEKINCLEAIVCGICYTIIPDYFKITTYIGTNAQLQNLLQVA